MSDPQPNPGKSKPPRAEPLQPDNPGRGDDVQGGSGGPESPVAEEKRRQQSEDALKNVREGYD